MWAYHYHWLWGFGWLLVLVLVFGLSRLFWCRRRCWGHGWGPPWGPGGFGGEAQEILRQRLARGEIDQAEYDRIREVLKR